jgi:hypothetical protein
MRIAKNFIPQTLNLISTEGYIILEEPHLNAKVSHPHGEKFQQSSSCNPFSKHICFSSHDHPRCEGANHFSNFA